MNSSVSWAKTIFGIYLYVLSGYGNSQTGEFHCHVDLVRCNRVVSCWGTLVFLKISSPALVSLAVCRYQQRSANSYSLRLSISCELRIARFCIESSSTSQTSVPDWARMLKDQLHYSGAEVQQVPDRSAGCLCYSKKCSRDATLETMASTFEITVHANPKQLERCHSIDRRTAKQKMCGGFCTIEPISVSVHPCL